MSFGDKRGARFLLGVLVLLVATTIYFKFGAGRFDDSNPVALNLQTDGSWAESHPFDVSDSGGYGVSYRVAKKYPFRESECLAGVGMPYPDSTRTGLRRECPPGFYAPRVEWQIFSRGKPVIKNDFADLTGGEYSDKTVGSVLGWVELKAGTPYTLKARLDNASGRLVLTTPEIAVWEQRIESRIFYTFLYTILAIILAALGGFFITAELRIRRSR